MAKAADWDLWPVCCRGHSRHCDLSRSIVESIAAKATFPCGMLVLGIGVLGEFFPKPPPPDFFHVWLRPRNQLTHNAKTYQLGRAFTAVTLQEDTVDIARHHALQLIRVEEQLRIFWEPGFQRFFLRHPSILTWINRIYSFIHIPGTIAFLVWLYYYTVKRNQIGELYQARRRTLAVCNLLAFVMFTFWPCMPPRLLSDPAAEGPEGELGRSYGFVDTVHGANGAGSVWTENRFCNQYGESKNNTPFFSFVTLDSQAHVLTLGLAAMPSLHFGYSLMIGLTIMAIPLPSRHRRTIRSPMRRLPGLRAPSWGRLLALILGLLYPSIILVAILATANHFILDAVAGAVVCLLGWRFNGIMLNLLPLEDCFLWIVRIHKPELLSIRAMSRQDDWESDEAASGRVMLVA